METANFEKSDSNDEYGISQRKYLQEEEEDEEDSSTEEEEEEQSDSPNMHLVVLSEETIDKNKQ